MRAAPRPPSPGRLFRNAGLWLVVAVASPLIVAPITAVGANHVLWQRDPSLVLGASGLAIVVVDLVLLDLWTYWLHRAYHRVPIMWRLHEVHHRDEFLDTTSAVRFHLFEVVLSAALRLIPIMVLATPLTTVIFFEALLLSAAFFHHSNLRLPPSFERMLSWVVVTPSIHWVHHHAVRADTDSNYASILSIWDRLFGSRSRTERTPGMKIGAEGVEELSFLGLLLSPLVKKDQ
jgi:sterol desaturase/sphingolipid hydroxylase (fatty acid hydroxylase superfamily)